MMGEIELWLEREQQIIADVRARTGYSFPSLAWMNLRERVVAEKVLPILAEWVARLEYSNLRTAVYAVFGSTDLTYDWLDDLLHWWSTEPDEVAKSQLTTLIPHFVRPDNGEKVWRTCQDAQFLGQAEMFSPLARIPHLKKKVIARILGDLEKGNYLLSDLEIYAKLPDPQVRNWFAHQQSSPDRRIRALAQRVMGKTPKRPDWIMPDSAEPDRWMEVHSTEIDLDVLDRELRKITRKLGLQHRRLGAEKAFLAFAESDRWFTGVLGSTGDATIHLWLRAEDSDTVEVVVTRVPIVSPKETAYPS